MASFNDKITVVIDVVTQKATKGIKDFKSSVAEAEGFTGKLKAGVGSLGAQFKASAMSPAALAGGVAAAGAVALKAVDEFAQLGIEVGAFSDATGLAAEDASRWIEVAGDVGVEAGSLQSAIGKLNKSIDPEKFAELGIEIAKTAEGATDVNRTFLNVIDKLNGIKDPAERAKVATKLLGKGWQDMAELIGQGSSALSKSLSEVADAKVIDAEEVQKARDYRAAMDKLNDAFQEIMITIGEELAPAVSKAADDFADLIGILRTTNEKVDEVSETVGYDLKQAFINAVNPIENVKFAWEGLMEEFGDGEKVDEATTSMDEFTASTNKGRGALNEWNPAAKLAKEHADELAESTRKLNDATKDYTDSYAELLGKLDEQEAWEGVIEKVFAAADGIDDTKQEARDAKRELAEYIDKFADIPDSVKTSLIAKLDQGAVNEVTAYLNGLRAGVTVPVKPVGSGGSTLGGGGKRASGGQVQAGAAYTIGEQGAEVFVPNTNGVVVPHGAAIAGGGGGGNHYSITINGTGMSPDEIVAAIKRHERRNGTGWRS